MIRLTNASLTVIFSFMLLNGCTPTVKVEAPEKPIDVNMNINIKHKIKVKKVDQSNKKKTSQSKDMREQDQEDENNSVRDVIISE